MAKPAKLPGDVDGLYLLVEPLFVALNEKRRMAEAPLTRICYSFARSL